MIIRSLYILCLISIVSCSIYKTRRNFYESSVTFRNGVYKDKKWESDLVFERYSWYSDAALNNEILLTEINEESDFYVWLDRDIPFAKKCSKFYIALVYSSFLAKQKYSYITEQFKKNNINDRLLVDFGEQIKAHQNFIDWSLFDHKVVGLCDNNSPSKAIEITMPGFPSKKIH
jgi:hypothetical protein